MPVTATLDASQLHADVAELHDAIAHLVAFALETGGATWQVAAPLVHDLLDGTWSGVAPVVVARAVGHVQARQAADVRRALDAEDFAPAVALLAELQHAHERLVNVLAQQTRSGPRSGSSGPCRPAVGRVGRW